MRIKKIQQVRGFNTAFQGGQIKLPKNAVYITTHDGITAWVEDIRPAYFGQSFVLRYFNAHDKTPRRKTATAKNDEICKALVKFIDNLPPEYVQKPVYPITHKDAAAAGAPKDRTIPAPMYRGRPDPNPMTAKFVTDGCRIGQRFYKEEGYWDRLK